jgi:hypothetical protein
VIALNGRNAVLFDLFDPIPGYRLAFLKGINRVCYILISHVHKIVMLRTLLIGKNCTSLFVEFEPNSPLKSSGVSNNSCDINGSDSEKLGTGFRFFFQDRCCKLARGLEIKRYAGIIS